MSLIIPQHKSCFRSELITKDQQLTVNMAGTCESKVGPIPSICPNWHPSTDTNSPTTYIKALKQKQHILQQQKQTQKHFKHLSRPCRKHFEDDQQTTKNNTQKPSTKKTKGNIKQKKRPKGHLVMEFPSHAAWLDFRSPEDEEVDWFRDLQYTCDDWFILFIHNKSPSYRILG